MLWHKYENMYDEGCVTRFLTIRENAIISTVIGKFRVLLGVYIIHNG